MANEIVDKNTENNEMPDVSKWVKVFYAETKTGERTQVAFVEKIPVLEEAPDQITGSALDLDYEFAQPGIKKASNIELDIYYTHTQHKTLRTLKDKELYWFFQNPAHTAQLDYHKKIRCSDGKYRSEIYICRGSERRKRLDRRAVGIISIALGHSREDTAITNYIRNL